MIVIPKYTVVLFGFFLIGAGVLMLYNSGAKVKIVLRTGRGVEIPYLSKMSNWSLLPKKKEEPPSTFV